MMKLIAFLGTGRYETVKYYWNDLECETQFVQRAFAEWLKPEAICILLTEAARGKRWEDLRKQLEEYHLHPVNIPDGKSEQELWEIFRKISDAVDTGEEIVFDITHGFRSLPMIALLTIAYLKQVKNVRFKHLLYGAYEARDERGRPVFDLTPFANLLDWLALAQMFLTTGNARRLGELIEEIQNTAFRNPDPSTEDRPQALKNFGEALTEVSDNLLMARVPTLPESVGKLLERLERAREEVRTWAPPLDVLLSEIKEAYAPFADKDNPLKTQAELIKWYFNRDHIIQATTLAREWTVSYYLHQEGKDWQDKQAREQMEEKLGRNLKDEPLWSKITTVRNDLAHCGFGRAEKQVLKVESIRKKAEEIVKEIKHLASELPAELNPNA